MIEIDEYFEKSMFLTSKTPSLFGLRLKARTGGCFKKP